jgi:hypothetical protein
LPKACIASVGLRQIFSCYYGLKFLSFVCKSIDCVVFVLVSWHRPPRIYCPNVQSLVKDDAVDSVASELTDNDIDFAFITETFSKDTHADDLVDIDGFETFRFDRRLGKTTKRCGGGVVVYAKHDYCNSARIWRNGLRVPRGFEVAWVEATVLGGIQMYVAAVNAPLNRCNSKDRACLTNYLKRCKNLLPPTAIAIVGGDWNTIKDSYVVEATGFTS